VSRTTRSSMIPWPGSPKSGVRPRTGVWEHRVARPATRTSPTR
jgi:hypothetical protein